MSLSFARFELDTLVAPNRGGEGVLWKARDAETGAVVALKVLAGPAPDDLTTGGEPEVLAAHGALAAESPHWPAVLGLGIATAPEEVFGGRPAFDGRHAWCATEWVTGTPLSETIAAGPLGSEKAAQLGSQIAHAVAEAHKRGFAHLGLKPGNVLVTGDGPVLVDCRTVWGELGDRRGGGRDGQAASYLAPEQKLLPGGKQPEDPVGPRADVYALGALVAALATGSHLPSDGALAEVDAPLRVLCDRATSRDPELRFASAHGFAAALDNYLAPEASGSPVGGAAGARAFDRKRLGLGIALAAIALAAGVTLWPKSEPTNEATQAGDVSSLSAPADSTGTPNTLPAPPEGDWRPPSTRDDLAGTGGVPGGSDDTTNPGDDRAPSNDELPGRVPLAVRANAPGQVSDFSAHLPSEPEEASSPEAVEAATTLGRRANLALSNFTFHPADITLLRRTHGPLAIEIADLVARYGAQAGAPFASERRRLLELFRPLPADPAKSDPWLAYEVGRVTNGTRPTEAFVPPSTLLANAILANATLSGASEADPSSAAGSLSDATMAEASDTAKASTSAEAADTAPPPPRSDSLTRSATLAPNATEFDHLFAALVALRRGDAPSAKRALQGVPRGTAELLEEVARFQERGQSFSKSERDQIDAMSQRYSILNVEAGVLALDLGDTEAALAHFDRALQRYPDHAGAHHHRAIALARLDRMDEARYALERATGRTSAPPLAPDAALPWPARSSATYLAPFDAPAFDDKALAPLIGDGE